MQCALVAFYVLVRSGLLDVGKADIQKLAQSTRRAAEHTLCSGNAVVHGYPQYPNHWEITKFAIQFKKSRTAKLTFC
jgi:pyruvate/2-oxoacid:ferredoxin oxidoreductase beta subunit